MVVLIIFPVILQTDINVIMLSIGRQRVTNTRTSYISGPWYNISQTQNKTKNLGQSPM